MGYIEFKVSKLLKNFMFSKRDILDKRVYFKEEIELRI